jgi:RHS repeat-associated protein
VERYLYGAGVDNVLSRTSAGGVVWSLADRQGSVVDLVDGAGNVLNHFVYDSFGNRSESTSADFRFGYTGRELDGETGLYYYRARYYDPSLGRFISEDPIGFSAGDTNLYRYVSNSPTNFTDPTGKFAILPILAAAAVVGLTGAGIGAAWGFASGVAQSFDSDRRNDILGWDSVGSAYIHGLIGAGKGAALGFGIAFAGSVAVGTALAAGAPAWIVGGAVYGAGVVGVGAGVISAANNFSQGNYATAAVDLAGSIYGGSKLWSTYQGAKQQAFDRAAANARPISQVGDPRLNSSGQIVPTQSSALATRTSIGGAIVPYSNPSAGSLVLANSASSAIAGATSTVTGQLLIPTDPFYQYLQHPNYSDLSIGALNKLSGYIAEGEVQLIRSTPYDLQTAGTIRNNVINSGVNKLSTRYIKGKGNIAFAEGIINDTNISQVRAFAGKEHLQGYATLPQNRQLVSEKLGRVDRKFDSESKILEEILKITKPGDIGAIKIFSERFVCNNCGDMISQFKRLRPHIKIIISTGE